MKSLTIPAVGTALTGVGILSALNLDTSDYQKLRLVEVRFYAKNNAENAEERIKVAIENLSDFSRFKFYKKENSNSNNGKWLSLNEAGSDYKKYEILATIAKYFFLNQHYLNIAKSLYLIKEENKNTQVTCPDNCKNKPECCNKQDCNNLVKEHRQFFYHLNNLNTLETGAYLSPVQAHISLGDLKFSDLTAQTATKIISGSLVYRHVDYWYSPKKLNDWKIPDGEKSYYKLDLATDNGQANSGQELYFANYPTTFSMKLEKGEIKKGEAENDLLSVYDKLTKQKEFDNLLTKKESLKTCCCDQDPKQGTFDCLLSSNFVTKESNLSNIQTLVKEKKSCQA